ncbi:MAG: hypothetical protein AVDCRST_MAG73-3845 [uncultured Thermomicrobiales bacterium]|uniref:Protein from nitrogen regulatory protein P-II (GLNB) family, ortholog YAAQ B. subtilis n=1 Tax=uncultured Thermomicrobiales bacterium TaxID=1645740 RepID=A0A6J4UXC5_9BACT|nr:MAG: hypothetical protein AVDCRST_MAG73-3845 [uncultured Thermomicrobiales bacterium]
MKLVVAVIQVRDADVLLPALAERGFGATVIDSAGGFLRERNATLLIGVSEAEVATVLRTIALTCQARTRFVNPLMPIAEPGEFFVANPLEVLVGGATVFVLAVARYERIG